MAAWITDASAVGVFLAIGAVGFLFLLVSLIFGEIFDHLDWSGGDHDFDHGGPGILSPRVLAAFITAFGCFGAVAVYYGLSTPAASGVGLASGVLLGGAVYLFARLLHAQQSTTQVVAADWVGRDARVVVAIPARGVGQVRCRVGEELVDKIARAEDGGAIPEHASVRIVSALGEAVVVKPL